MSVQRHYRLFDALQGAQRMKANEHIRDVVRGVQHQLLVCQLQLTAPETDRRRRQCFSMSSLHWLTFTRLKQKFKIRTIYQCCHKLYTNGYFSRSALTSSTACRWSSSNCLSKESIDYLCQSYYDRHELTLRPKLINY
jgi:hypothetical protein